MAKYKATISVDREIWDAFLEVCRAKGSTAAAEMTNFMILAIAEGEELQDTRVPLVLAQIKEQLRGDIARWINAQYEIIRGELSQQITLELSNQNSPPYLTETSEINTETVDSSVIGVEETNQAYHQTTIAEEIESVKPSLDVSSMDGTGRQKEEKGLSDAGLKKKHKLSESRTTIGRWRRKERAKPPWVNRLYEVRGSRWYPK